MYYDGNIIKFDHSVDRGLHLLVSALFNIIEKKGYKDVVLDFSEVTFLSPQIMLPLVAKCRYYRYLGVDFEIIFPKTIAAKNILLNANWAHLIVPEKYDSELEKNINHMSARQYLNSAEQYSVVDSSMEVLLRSIDGLDRSKIKALEWALNEITDNVLNHAESPIGGIVQVTSLPNIRRVEFHVCDAGATIPVTLRTGRPDLRDDRAALSAAIEEGVTRNVRTNQGNGLYGTFKCCDVSGGEFDIVSGNVSLSFKNGNISVQRGTIPYKGTYVRASIGYDFEHLLEHALVFRGRAHDPAQDYVERVYENDLGVISFEVENELKAFGSREAGQSARTKIDNLTGSLSRPIEFDFNNVALISSSFADEVFGKIFETLGPIRFGQRCKFKNIDPTVQGLIDRAIEQRMRH